MNTDNAIKQNFPENCQTHLDALAKSPTFAMSLGAKELFHTNFLAFLLESEDNELATVRSALTKLLFDTEREIGKVVCWREKNNLDLVVMRVPNEPLSAESVHDFIGSHKYFAAIIEAKLKSIPTDDQLENYNNKLQDGIAFEFDEVDQIAITKEGNDNCLWSTTKIKLVENEEEGSWLITAQGKTTNAKSRRKIAELSGKVCRILLLPDAKFTEDFGPWEKKGWPEIAKVCQSHEGKSVLSVIVKDYGDSFDHLLNILFAVRKHVEVCWGASGSPKAYDTYYSGIVDHKFKTRRIHDLIGKSASRLLEEKIKIAIEEARNCRLKTPQNFDLNTYTHYSNQQPGIGFEWLGKRTKGKMETRISFGVQIQGRDYRHFVCAEGGDKAARTDVLNKLCDALNTTHWFESIQLARGPMSLAGHSAAGKQYLVFDESKFRYTRTDISELKLQDIANVVVESLTKAEEAIDPQLHKAINEFLDGP